MTVPVVETKARKSWHAILPIAALVAGSAVLAGCDAANGSAPVAAAAPVPVQVVRVAEIRSLAERSYTGELRARVETDLAFRVPGKIAGRKVDAGSRVVAGQVLAELDAEDYRLAVAAAEADVAAAGAQATQTAADEQRFRTLLAQGHVSAAEYDRRKALAVAAAERLTAARRQLDLAGNRLDYTILRADADGVVTEIAAETGQVMSTGAKVVRLARDGELEAVVAIPEQALAAVRGSTATVSFWTDPDTRYPATLRELSADADPVTRSYAARFTVQAPAAALGMTAIVHLTGAGPTGVATLPRSALADFGDGPTVWRVEEATGRLTRLPVRTVGFQGDAVQVAGDLATGDAIVAIGAHRLDAGQTVRIVQTRAIAAR